MCVAPADFSSSIYISTPASSQNPFTKKSCALVGFGVDGAIFGGVLQKRTNNLTPSNYEIRNG